MIFLLNLSINKAIITDKKLNLSKKITFSNFSVKISEFDFYEIEVFNDKEFSYNELYELKNAQVQLGAKKLPVLVICQEFASTDTNFIKHLAQNQNNPYSKADAFVIKSMAHKILANFYLKITNPERPTKFFKNKEEAIQWLKQYI